MNLPTRFSQMIEEDDIISTKNSAQLGFGLFSCFLSLSEVMRWMLEDFPTRPNHFQLLLLLLHRKSKLLLRNALIAFQNLIISASFSYPKLSLSFLNPDFNGKSQSSTSAFSGS